MILLVGSEKGGTGKSTLATNIAVWLAMQGEKMILLDTDLQGTSVNWSNVRDESGWTPRIQTVSKSGRIHNTILDLEAQYGTVVVDVGGHDSDALRSALLVADILVIPVQASQPDLETLFRMQSLVDSSRLNNPDLDGKVILVREDPNPMRKFSGMAKAFFKEYHEDLTPLVLMRSRTTERSAYRHAIAAGQSVLELNQPQAKAEIQLIVTELFHDHV